MAGFKLSLALASMAIGLASARNCQVNVQDWIETGGVGGGGHHHRITLFYEGTDAENDYLDYRDNTEDWDFDVYDGKQTLTSDELGGDVLIWATHQDKAQWGIESCQGQFTDNEFDGEVSDGNRLCVLTFPCTVD